MMIVGRYRLLEKAEMPKVPGGGRELLDPGTEIVWIGKPGPHMEPLDDNAHEAVRRSGNLGTLDPTRFLSLSTPVARDGSPAEPPEVVFVGANGKPLAGAALDKAKAAYAAAAEPTNDDGV